MRHRAAPLTGPITGPIAGPITVLLPAAVVLSVTLAACTGDDGGAGSTTVPGVQGTLPPLTDTTAPLPSDPLGAGATTSSGPTTTSPRVPALATAVRLAGELSARVGVVLDGVGQSCAATRTVAVLGAERVAALGAAAVADLDQADRDAIAGVLGECVPPAALATAFRAALELPEAADERADCLGRALVRDPGITGLVAVADGLAAGVPPGPQARAAARRAIVACPEVVPTTDSAPTTIPVVSVPPTTTTVPGATTVPATTAG